MDKDIGEIILSGGVGTMPTDTIYGMVCSAMDTGAVKRIYDLKSRAPYKPLIILVSNSSQIGDCGVSLDNLNLHILDEKWRRSPSSIILPADNTLQHVHKGLNTIALRIPYSKPELLKLLSITGPIVATSVNISGESPLLNLEEIKQEFPNLDFYIGGRSGQVPSALYRLINDSLEPIER